MSYLTKLIKLIITAIKYLYKEVELIMNLLLAKNEKAAINSKDMHDEICYKYTITLALNKKKFQIIGKESIVIFYFLLIDISAKELRFQLNKKNRKNSNEKTKT